MNQLLTKKKKKMRKINEIIVHCSDTPAGEDFTVKDIDNWHKQRGWSGIGYHYVVYRDGTVHEGRSIDKAGAHCLGHNANSIGICYIGGRSPRGERTRYYDTRTDAQKEGLLGLIKALKIKYPSIKSVVGHCDYDKGKSCPCFDAKSEYKNV